MNSGQQHRLRIRAPDSGVEVFAADSPPEAGHGEAPFFARYFPGGDSIMTDHAATESRTRQVLEALASAPLAG